MNGYLDFFIKCFLPFLLSSIILVFIIFRKNNKNKIIKEKCEKYLLSNNSELFKYIDNAAHNIDKSIIGSTVELSFFDLFKNKAIDDIFNSINKKIENEGINWIFKNIKFDNNYIKEYGSYICIESASIILHSDYITLVLSNVFSNAIIYNINNIDKIEKEAIEYHNQFGNDSDIELHPADTKIDTNDISENYQTTLDNLVSTGTVEMMEDD